MGTGISLSTWPTKTTIRSWTLTTNPSMSQTKIALTRQPCGTGWNTNVRYSASSRLWFWRTKKTAVHGSSLFLVNTVSRLGEARTGNRGRTLKMLYRSKECLMAILNLKGSAASSRCSTVCQLMNPTIKRSEHSRCTTSIHTTIMNLKIYLDDYTTSHLHLGRLEADLTRAL